MQIAEQTSPAKAARDLKEFRFGVSRNVTPSGNYLVGLPLLNSISQLPAPRNSNFA